MKQSEVRKYLRYGFEARSFDPALGPGQVSEAVLQSAARIRGPGRAPAIMIHGIMPRSGTVYVGELLRLHPDLHAYPHELWEFPFLQLAGDVKRLQREFLLAYDRNAGKMGVDDFLPLFGSSLVAHLYAAVPSGQRMLLKVPSAQYLSHFVTVFPHEHLLVLVRDGRDLVQSTVRTWPHLRFWQVCQRWNRAARMVQEVDRRMSAARRPGYWLARYEDALEAPEAFVREACLHFDLDPDRYPYDQIDSIPVQGSSALAGGGRVNWRWVKRPKDFRPVGYWRKWSAYRKWLFKRLAGRSLIGLGYCEDLKW